MHTYRELRDKLNEIDDLDLDKDVLMEGCDCIREWTGVFDISEGSMLMKSTLS